MKKKVKITELSEVKVLEGLWILGVNASNKGVKAAISLLRGLDGKEVEMRVTATALQYRLTGGIWKELLTIAVIQKPATDAASRADAKMIQISADATQTRKKLVEDAGKVNTDLTAAVGALEERAETVILQTKTAKDNAITATATTITATSKTGEATAAALKAVETVDAAKKAAMDAAMLANEKAEKAELKANYAGEQAEYAKEQGDKATRLASRIEALETGKIDGGYAENNELILTSGGVPVGDPIPVGSGTGGGGGGGGVLVKVMPIGSALLSAILGGTLRIGYTFTSTYLDDQTETGDGTATCLVNSQKIATMVIQQGANYFDVTKHLVAGTNKVKVTVLDSTGQTRSTQFTVEVISLSLSDSYDDTLINTGAITYRYTPIGAIEKTVHFILDGVEIGTEVTSDSNRQHSRVIPAQTHGAHRLEVYMTATVNGVEVRSNTLAHDLICTVGGNNTVIVASPFNQTEAKQYDKLVIPFVVYSPAASTATVVLSVNGTTLSEQTVDRLKQTWNYRINQPGELVLKIASGSVSKTFDLTVSEAETIIEAETADLALYLTAQNRSNNDNNKSEWTYNDISAILTNFNYKTNGWITENGSTVLSVSGDARASIPFKIFDNDFRAIGKTIEFEFTTRDVIDYTATVISCLAGGIGLQVTAQEALFKSEQTTVDTRFKEEERVRVAFVIEKKTEHRLIYIYINGILSGVSQYPEDDNFQQSAPANITIGSNDCTVNIYNIRIYNNDLTQYQLLDNFIADIDDYDRRMEVYNRNRVYDEYGNISYQKVLEKIPCMILEGTLPTYKGDKKTNKVFYTDLQEPTRSFECLDIQNDVQGTSSQFYPRKNYKYKFKTDIIYTESITSAPTYALRAGGIPVNCFCLKADFAESSGAHNTGMAKLADRLLKNMGILTPPQRENAQVRTTIDGHPICVFHRVTPIAPLTFLGKYNFNNDKSTVETFGFEDGDECWEFLNNTSDRVIFKSADFSTDDWQNDFEARYPDESTDSTNLKAICEWIVSTKDNPAKFKAEVTEHFVVDNLLVYYLITELFGMVDQRAKNMFLTHYHTDVSTAGNKLWRFIIYDSDTQSGINNEGACVFNYNIEYHDTIGTQNVWNGEQSVLWKNLEESFADELAAMYQEIRSSEYLSYDYTMTIYDGEQSDQWCEAIYNADSRFKYIDPLIETGNGSYLYAAQGSRKEHRKWWLYNRFLYMDSKYNAGDFLSDFATARLYTPQNWAGVAPSANITVTPFADSYVRIKYGSYLVGLRCQKGVPITIEAPDIEFNDTETIIYGASRIKSLGNLSGLYAGTIDMSRATRLAILQIGSEVEGYHNDSLMHLSVGSNKMLRLLGIQNCPNLTQAVDLSGCDNIEEVYAQGTGITAVVLPPAGILTKLYLPGTIANLTLANQAKLLNAMFKIADVSKLSTIICDNTPVDILSVVERCMWLPTPVLNRVRIINIDGRSTSLDALYKLTKVGGVDDKGNNLPVAVVTGKYYAMTAVENKLTAVRAAFPELTVTYTTLKPPTVTTFTFTSSRSKLIANSSLVCNFEYAKVNEYTYTVIADDDSVIDLTFKCDNHADFTSRYIVAATRTQPYTAQYIPLRTIRVQEYNTSTYPADASLIVGDKVYTTDANGYVYIRSGKEISGTFAAQGYGNSAFNYPFITNDVSHTLIVYAVVDIRFRIENPVAARVLISGATVTCDGKSAITNTYGECIIPLSKGTYSYAVSHPNYIDVVEEVTIGATATTALTYLHIDVLTFKPEENGNIQLLLLGGEVKLCLNSKTTDYVIDWGDGTTTCATSTGYTEYIHTYLTTGYYNIEVSNNAVVNYCCEMVSNYEPMKSTIAYWSIGSSNVKGLTFDNFIYMEYVGDLWKNDRERTSLTLFCTRCGWLKYINLSSFINNSSATHLTGFLSDCTSLASIDLTPLANMLKITHLDSLLQDNYNLTYIILGWTTPPPASSNTLKGTRTGPIYVPDASVEFYKAATNWSQYAARFQPISSKPV